MFWDMVCFILIISYNPVPELTKAGRTGNLSSFPLFFQFIYSIIRLCPALSGCMNRSTPDFPVLHCLPEFDKLMSIDSVMPSNHLILCLPLLPPSVFPSIRAFSSESLLASSGQSIGASVSASVLPVNIQGWFPLGLTHLISLLSKGLWESSQAPQFESVSSSVLNIHYSPTFTSIHGYWKTIALTKQTFVGQVMSIFNMLSRFVITFFQGATVF